MKPYYEEPGITIYHGDCRKILPELPKVDLVLTDPPYDKYTHIGALTKSKRYKEFGVEFSHLEDPAKMLNILLQCTDKWLIVFCSLEMLGRYQSFRPDKYVRGGVWDRICNAPQISGDRPAQAVEGLAILHGMRKNMQWNGGGKSAIYRHMVERNHKEHPTQKPLKLIKELTGLFSNDGETILDPFMGSGTTLKAAKELGRQAIGIEMEEKYCEIAVNRLRQEMLPFEMDAAGEGES